MTTAPARLGERLQYEQGLLWLHRMKGDPYAALLCDVDEDPGPLRERVRAVGPLWRSATGPWVTGDPAMGAALLADPRLAPAPVLPGDGDGPPPAGPVPPPEGVRVRLPDALGPEFDLVTEVAEPLVAAALAEACGIPADEHERFARAVTACGTALDATVCPQRLDTTRRLHAAADALRSLLAAVPGAPVPATVVAAARTGADLIVRTLLRARFPLPPAAVGPTVSDALRERPPVWIAPLVARAEVPIAGERIAAGERVAVLIGDGHGHGQDHGQDLAPFRRALAEGTLAAFAARYAELRPAGPAVRRPRAPLTRGPARVPVRATAAATGGGGR
ncbi:hypothetical protein [Kitasatospora sp. NPDC054795]